MIDQPVYIAPQAIACLGNSVAISTGTFAGQLVTGDGSVVVGCLVAPVGGVVSVSVNGAEPWTFAAGTLDVDGNGFAGNADDYDRWMLGWRVGYVGCDYNGDGWTTGDDFDGFVSDFLRGEP